uniref:Ribosomal protein S18 n=1 Tax=Apoglossum ruscifolium TaxID=167976 RepID=A0A4D6WL53_9FLOR|nr:ribosomal protein S18 [Apoglossum ruscifolium]
MNLSKKINANSKKNELLDYKDIDTLRKYINDQAKILSRRSTGLNAKQQKQMSQCIKRARILALLPFLNKD